MPDSLHFYGERGLVDSLFLDLSATGKLVDFLNEIDFPFRDARKLGITRGAEIAVIVEAGFGGSRAGFGWPDAVVVVTLPTGSKLIVFVEAKTGLYFDEAADFTARKKGFNSKINGQLSLRFRLAHALRSYGGGARLVEPDDVARAYGEESRPRRLAKMDNIDRIVRKYLVGAANVQNEYLFVALTDDDANVWGTISRPELLPFVPKRLGANDDIPDDLWAIDKNAWEEHRCGFGWVSFSHVERLIADEPFFSKAKHFLHAKRAARNRTRTAGEVNRSSFSAPRSGCQSVARANLNVEISRRTSFLYGVSGKPRK